MIIDDILAIFVRLFSKITSIDMSIVICIYNKIHYLVGVILLKYVLVYNTYISQYHTVYEKRCIIFYI